MKTRIIPVLIVLFCFPIGGLQSARAATIIVTNTNDSGPGSLRQALVDANDRDTINFDPVLVAQTITLTSGQLYIRRDVIITGPGAAFLTVDGNAHIQSGVFYVKPGKTATISGLTIKNGSSGIYNDDGALTLTACTVSGNSGSGIANVGTHSGATMTVSNCTVSDNAGSGIANAGIGDSATLTVTDSIISGNSGSGIGNSAALAGGSAAVTVTDSTISSNSGSGIANTFGAVTITACTVSGNSGAWGGGIFNNGSGQGTFSLLIVTNSTISGNSAALGGGGIYNVTASGGGTTVAINNSTISENSAGQGGGIYNDYAGGGLTVAVGSTILKAGTLGENIFNLGGTVTSLGYNLSSDDGGGFLTGAGDQINTDPLLGPLQDNGGTTFTHALLPGSPAINAGDPSFTPPPSYDQRGPGFRRVRNGRIDTGSYEVQRRLH
nr:hypothetical protein Hi04_10k_c4773_00005 [uncultured bacterium]